jgi:hypothetical protein
MKLLDEARRQQVGASLLSYRTSVLNASAQLKSIKSQVTTLKEQLATEKGTFNHEDIVDVESILLLIAKEISSI